MHVSSLDNEGDSPLKSLGTFGTCSFRRVDGGERWKLNLVAIYISIYMVSTERSRSADEPETDTPNHSLHSSPAEKVPTLYAINMSTHFALLQSRCPHHIPASQTTRDAHHVPVAVIKYYQMHPLSKQMVALEKPHRSRTVMTALKALTSQKACFSNRPCAEPMPCSIPLGISCSMLILPTHPLKI